MKKMKENTSLKWKMKKVTIVPDIFGFRRSVREGSKNEFKRNWNSVPRIMVTKGSSSWRGQKNKESIR